jgi:hypothetical protein
MITNSLYRFLYRPGTRGCFNRVKDRAQCHLGAGCSRSADCHRPAARLGAVGMTEPEISPVSQLWQTPVRHDQRTGTSHASASSSRLWKVDPQCTARLLRAPLCSSGLLRRFARVSSGAGA